MHFIMNQTFSFNKIFNFKFDEKRKHNNDFNFVANSTKRLKLNNVKLVRKLSFN